MHQFRLVQERSNVDTRKHRYVTGSDKLTLGHNLVNENINNKNNKNENECDPYIIQDESNAAFNTRKNNAKNRY